jgi:heme/copper-type cytochrome/quinol oxidase subunit 2
MWGTLAFFLVVALAISLAFAIVAVSTRSPRAIDLKEAYRFRRIVFVFLLVSLLAFLWVTLGRLPYPQPGARPDQVIHVAARQFGFALSESPITNNEEWARRAGSPPELPSGALIEFRVTSLDVNAASACGPDGRLVAQTPGDARVRQPPESVSIAPERTGFFAGVCGLAHHAMRAEVTVR